MIALSRNTPIATVFGAAGFLGSHLVDKLLEKNIQVIGVDDLSSGTLFNLSEASKNSKFHFLHQSAQTEVAVDLPRLDYAIFVLNEEVPSFSVYKRALEHFLSVAKTHQAKVLFVSDIDNYDPQNDRLSSLKHAEEFLAHFATTNNLNARVLRLSAVFGPRMHFRSPDPLIRLIRENLAGDLTSPVIPLDFSSRAIYVTDAVNLLTKALLSGVTAHKIYDGSSLQPIKLSDVKQILSDPVRFEAVDFKFSPVADWPTPNLLKTQKELNWKVATPITSALKATTGYFREHPQFMPQVKSEVKKEELMVDPISRPVFSLDPKELKRPGDQISSTEPTKSKPVTKKLQKWVSLSLGLGLIGYAFFYPLGETVWALGRSYQHLSSVKTALAASDFVSATSKVNLAKASVAKINNRYKELQFLTKIPTFKDGYLTGSSWLENLNLVVEAADQTVLAAQNLNRGAKIVSGEGEGDSTDYFQRAELGFSQAEQKLAAVNSDLETVSLDQNLKIFKDNWESVKVNLKDWQARLSSARVLSTLLPEVVSGDQPKLMLVLLKSESSLRPSGGEVVSILEAEFAGGKLKNIQTKKLADLSGAQNIGLIADLNSEGDFATFAKKWEIFYTGLTGKTASTVISLDFQALASLLKSVGPINLKDQGTEASMVSLESSTQVLGANTDLAEGALAGVTRNLLLVSTQDWSKLSADVNNLVAQKHLMVYSSDPKLLAYLTRANWSGRIPKQVEIPLGQQQDLVAILEDNLSAKKILNRRIGRSFQLDSKILPINQIKHHLNINYSYLEDQAEGEGDSEDYLAEVRLFLSAGTRLTTVFWGTTEITGLVSSFSDYGRAGYLVKIKLSPKEQKSLTFDLVNSQNFEFARGVGEYRLEFLKQAGTTDQEKLDYKLEYPWDFELIKTSKQNFTKGVGEISTNLELNKDQLFEFKFKENKE